jgi:hypothetical protein
MGNDDHELLSVGELLARYDLLELEPYVPPLDASFVPQALRYLVPYAQIWGVADDTLREVVLQRASREARSHLKRLIVAADDLLDEWLAGPDADAAEPSQEYVAFSAMRMAADLIER